MDKRVIPVLLLCALFSCDGKKGPNHDSSRITTITIATAANTQFAMRELEDLFEASQDSIKIEVVVSSSGKLTAQIQQGAPYDVFLSADMKYPDYLYKEGLALAPPRVYAQGALVAWSSSIQLDTTNWIAELQNAVKIAIANPEMAPYGMQALNAFKHLQIEEQIKKKLVFGESISQTNQYIISGACEIGLTAKSVVLSPNIKQKGSWVNIPTEVYQPIQQGLAITKYGSQHSPLKAQAFVDFLFSEKGRAILKKYGYIVD